MTPRSRIHMLMVAAARLEQEGGNPKLIADLRENAKWKASTKAEGRFLDDEERRIGRQRTKFNMLPSSRSTDELRDAMLQRAYDLMWDGMCTECDALVEFLPSADVERMFAAWESDQDGKTPKSKFYEAAQ